MISCISLFYIGGNGNPHGPYDPGEDLQQVAEWNIFSIGVTIAQGNGSTSGRNGGIAGLFQQRGAEGIPYIRQDKQVGFMMKAMEDISFLFLTILGCHIFEKVTVF
jgi:hypothetical protein